jgi:hypothetical protein
MLLIAYLLSLSAPLASGYLSISFVSEVILDALLEGDILVRGLNGSMLWKS